MPALHKTEASGVLAVAARGRPEARAVAPVFRSAENRRLLLRAPSGYNARLSRAVWTPAIRSAEPTVPMFGLVLSLRNCQQAERGHARCPTSQFRSSAGPLCLFRQTRSSK